MAKPPWAPKEEDIARAQRVLDRRPDGHGFDFSQFNDLIKQIMVDEGVDRAYVHRVWKRQTYSYLKRAGQEAS